METQTPVDVISTGVLQCFREKFPVFCARLHRFVQQAVPFAGMGGGMQMNLTKTIPIELPVRVQRNRIRLIAIAGETPSIILGGSYESK